MDYSNFIVQNCPESVIYIPNFISFTEETQILNYVNNSPKPKWTQLAHRRLLNYGGVPHPKGMIAETIPGWLQNYVDKINNLGLFESKNANHILVNEYEPGAGIMAHSDGPLFYPTISTVSCGSHTILEFYTNLQTQQPDDYLNAISMDNSSSSCSSCNKDSLSVNGMELNATRQLICKLLIEPRSLLILKHDMYTKYLHGISDVHEDIVDEKIKNIENCGETYKIGDKIQRQKRISLTIRHVPKTSRFKI